MDVLCRCCVIHGLFFSFFSFASGQVGGGVAIGLGGENFMLGSPFVGGLPSPFMTMVPTDATSPGPSTGPPTTSGVTMRSANAGSTPQTATLSTIGDGFNPSDIFSMFGGTGQGMVVNPGGAQNTYDIQTQPPVKTTSSSIVTTKRASIQINNLNQKGFTLQNEAYTPIGSVGNLVKVPTNTLSQPNTAMLQIPSKPNNDFADIIVKPVSSINSLQNKDINSGSASTQKNKLPTLSTQNFNPGTGMADEIAVLQSSILGSPVDMSKFVPPPSNPIDMSNFAQPPSNPSDMSASPVRSIGDLPVPAEFSTNPERGVPVNNPASPNTDPGTTIGLDQAYNPEMNLNPAANTNSLNIASPGTDRNTNMGQVGSAGNDFVSNTNSNIDSRTPPQTDPEINQPTRSSLRDMFSSSQPSNQDPRLTSDHSIQGMQDAPKTDTPLKDMTAEGIYPLEAGSKVRTPIGDNSPVMQDAQITDPPLKDMTAEGIYPFEAGSRGQAPIGESGPVIQDMNKAIADHNATEALHLTNEAAGISDVPPLTGTNGGRITNFVGAKPPQTLEGTRDVTSLQAPDIGMSEPNQVGNEPGGFVVGAGMPNAQLIQPSLVPDAGRPSMNLQGASGIPLSGDGISPFSESNPGLMKPSEPKANDMVNTLSSAFTHPDNYQPSLGAATENNPMDPLSVLPHAKGGLSRDFGSVDQPVVENTSANMNSNLEKMPTQKTITNGIPKVVESTAPGFDPRNQNFNSKINDMLSGNSIGNNLDVVGTDVGLVSQRNRQPIANSQKLVEAPAKSSPITNPLSGGSFVDPGKPMNQIKPVVDPINVGQNIGMMQGPPEMTNEPGLGVKTMQNVVTKDTSALNSASNQQIVAVKPEWLTNVFGEIGNALQTNTVETQPSAPNPLSNFGGNLDRLRSNRNDFNAQPQSPITQFGDLRKSLSNEVMPNTGSDRLQIVPLQNRGPSEPNNKVFTLGAHRVLDTVPNVQPSRQDIMADYQTQNVIGTSETKPLVPDGAAQMNNIQIPGISPNSVEMQLKNMMMLQDAQMAMSNTQKGQQDSSSVFTAFEAPGISMGRSVAVQESFGRQPNIVTIQAESNLPVSENRPSQQIAANLNEESSKVPSEQIMPPNANFGIAPDQNSRLAIRQMLTNDPMVSSFTDRQSAGIGQQINAMDTFANGLRLGQPVTNKNTQALRPGLPGRGIMLPMSEEATPFTSGNREAVFGSEVNTGRIPLNTGGVSTNLAGQSNGPPLMCNHVADPTDELYFMVRQRGGYQRLRCALGTAFDPATCECSRRLEEQTDCLEVHMDFNNGIVEDSSYNKLPIGNENVEVTNKSTPLSGIALFDSNSKLTIWRYQNYDFRDHVMLKVQFRPGQKGDRFQPLISNCDGDIEGPSIGIIYDDQLKEVLLVLKTSNDTKKELSFPINPDQWNDVTYIYDGKQFIGIVNGVRRYVSRTDPHLLGIIGGSIDALPATGLIEIRDAGIILGHCPRYGHYNGAMVDIQIYTCIPKNFRLENRAN